MFQPPRGTRDYLPEEQWKRNWVKDRIREVYEAYGFEPLETPAFEYLDLFKVKSGEEIINQIYTFKDKSDRELALRFEHTSSTVRVVATQKTLVLPFKRYVIGPVWRYERPTEKRFREFWQADIDIFGVESRIADAEVLTACVDALGRLGFEGFRVRVNDRRVLGGLVEQVGVPKEKRLDAFRAVDKLSKIGREGVVKELRGISPTEEASTRLLDIITVRGTAEEVLSHAEKQLGNHVEGLEGCWSLRSLLEYGEALGIKPYLSVDLSLARGLDYYTSSVFEVEALGYEDYGSIAGGGRYDEIVELFGGNPVPAVGISFGIDRLTPILDEKGVFQGIQRGARVYVAPIGEKPLRQALQITQALRRKGIPTLVDLMGRSLRRQLEYAAKKGVKWVVVVGERDLEKGVVTLRDMVSGDQREVPLDSVVGEVS